MNVKTAGLIVLLAVIFFVSRAHDIDRDPPLNISQSGGIIGDEAAYAHNARTKILFDEWDPDGWNPLYSSPVINFAAYGFYRVFGVGSRQLHMVGVWMSAAGILFTGLFIRKLTHTTAAAIFMIISTICFPLLVYNRQGFSENAALMFIGLSLYTLALGKNHGAWFILSGMFAGLVVGSKALLAYFIVLPMAGAWLLSKDISRSHPGLYRLGKILLVVLGILIILGPYIWMVIHYYDQIASFSRYTRMLVLPLHWRRAVANLLSPRIFEFFKITPWLSSMAGIAVITWIYTFFKNKFRLPSVKIFFLVWILGAGIAYSVLSYAPARYFVPLYPAVLGIVALYISELLKNKHVQDNSSRLSIPGIIVCSILMTLSLYFGLGHLRFSEAFSSSSLTTWFSPGVFLPASIFVIIIVLLVHRRLKSWRYFPVSRRCTAVIILAGIGVQFGMSYLPWQRNPLHQRFEISREIGQHIPRGVVGGLWAPMVCMENTLFDLLIYPNHSNYEPDLVEKYKLDHLFLTLYSTEYPEFIRVFPHIIKKAQPVKGYHIWQTDAVLFSLKDDWKKEQRLFFPDPDTGWKSELISIEIPSELEKGSSQMIQITYKNTGTQSWSRQEQVKLGALGEHDPLTDDNRIELPLDSSLLPGEQVTFSIRITAPEREGFCLTDWRLLKEHYAWFGEPVICVVKIIKPVAG